MLHSIPTEKLGPFGEPMAHAVQTCVHCGFCLAACPTYGELGQEMDTPRGRIVLMKEVLEGKLAWDAAQPHVERCLGCLACEPACPSGVPYRDLISPFRALAQQHFRQSPGVRLRRFLASHTLPYPARLRLATTLGRMAKPFRWLVPPALRPMLDLLPQAIRRINTTPPAPSAPARGRVMLLTGCAQQVLEPDINAATIEVLARNGIETIIPSGQTCCGGLAWHTGDLRAAQAFARRNLDAFAGTDPILTNAAGCGSTFHEYHLVLRGTPDEARASDFRRRVMDVSVFIYRLKNREQSAANTKHPPSLRCGAASQTPNTSQSQSDASQSLDTRHSTLDTQRTEDRGQRTEDRGRKFLVAYHDACHLANAQGVLREPRELLRATPGVELVELADPHLCCGSAGTYNLDQPDIAASLGARKARAVIETGADIVATGNIGCLVQLRAHLARLGSRIQVRHTMQVLRDGARW